MSDTTVVTEVTEMTEGNDDNKMVAAMAHALWVAEAGKAVPAEAEARKAAWKEAKRNHMRIAKVALKRLEKRGYSLVASGDAGGDEEQA